MSRTLLSLWLLAQAPAPGTPAAEIAFREVRPAWNLDLRHGGSGRC